jgi:arginine exporter protein ArgO
VYFAALILGLASTGAGPAEKAAFVAGAGLASLSWQELIAFVGSRLHRRLSPRARAATGILGNLVVIGLAVSIAIPLVAGSG